MRARIALILFCMVGCSNDDDRGRFVLTYDPSSASVDGSASDAQVEDGGRRNAVGGDVVGSPRNRLDASAGLDAASANGGQSDGALASPFQCQTSNDCAILNVGSCCGYFPRCANANAIFTAPNCADGVVGNCGFAAIDSCTCELGQCVSLQAGVRVTYP